MNSRIIIRFVSFFIIVTNLVTLGLNAMVGEQKALSFMQKASSLASTSNQTIFSTSNMVYPVNKLIEQYSNKTGGSSIGQFAQNSNSPLFANSQFLFDKSFTNKLALSYLKRTNNNEQKSETKKSKILNNNLFDLTALAAASGTLGAIAYNDLKDIDLKEAIDVAHGTLNIELFDQTKIPEEIEKAVARVFNGFNSGSGTIIKGQFGIYYVLTAQHCVQDFQLFNAYVQINNTTLKTNMLLQDELHDVAILMIEPLDVNQFVNSGNDLPAISNKLLSNVVPKRNHPVLLEGFPGFLPKEQQEPYKLLLASKDKITIKDTPTLKLVSHKTKNILAGASGGPIITILNNKPQIVGVYSMQRRKIKEILSLTQNESFAVGNGKLVDYFEKAEKIAYDKMVAEQNNSLLNSKNKTHWFTKLFTRSNR